jgi:hypothetical protein
MEIESFEIRNEHFVGGKKWIGWFHHPFRFGDSNPQQAPPTNTKSLDFTSEPELTMVFTIGNHSHFAIDLDFKFFTMDFTIGNS